MLQAEGWAVLNAFIPYRGRHRAESPAFPPQLMAGVCRESPDGSGEAGSTVGRTAARTPLRLLHFSSRGCVLLLLLPRAELEPAGSSSTPGAFPGSTPPVRGWAPCVQVVKEPLRTPQGQAGETASTNPRSFPELKAIKCFIDKPERGKYTRCIHSHTAWARPGLLLPVPRPSLGWRGGVCRRGCTFGCLPRWDLGAQGVICGTRAGLCLRAVPPAPPGALQSGSYHSG